jgi:hypothetical protein
VDKFLEFATQNLPKMEFPIIAELMQNKPKMKKLGVLDFPEFRAVLPMCVSFSLLYIYW